MTAEPLTSQAINVRSTGVQRHLRSSDLEAKLIDPLGDSAWERLVLSHTGANVFHSAAWAEVLVKTYGHQPFYHQFVRHGETVALVPLMEVSSPFTGRRGVCLPFSDCCGPLTFDENETVLGIPQISELARERNWKYVEVRGGGPQVGVEPVTRYYGHNLDLRGGLEKVFSRFASRARGAIRKAEKSGLRAESSSSKGALLEFYKLHVQTRRRHGIPSQPLSFFLNIYESIIKPGLGFVVLARRKSTPVAAAVFFQLGKEALYKFAASDVAFQELRGNNLVLWEGIKFLVQQNSGNLHFGRTSISNDGLRQFKQSWGTQEEMIEYFRFDPATDKWVTARGDVSGFPTTVFSKLPLPVNRMIGALVYPHLD